MDLESFASEAIHLTAPFIASVIVIALIFAVKDFATKLAKGMAFKFSGNFREGDKVIVDGENAVITKLGLTRTTFGIRRNECYVWRIVENDRVSFLKIERIIFTSVNGEDQAKCTTPQTKD